MNQQNPLQSYDPQAFDRPSVTVDVVLLTVQHKTLKVLLVQRTEQPFWGYWSLPGGFVGMQESLEDAATRVLRQKAGVAGVYLEQLYTFGQVNRDPRMRILSVAYYALADIHKLAHFQGAAGQWFEVAVSWEGESGGPAQVLQQQQEQPLAFDHAHILGMAVKRLRGKLNYAPIGFQLLPDRFTLRQLQEVHETILGKSLNKDSFRRKMLQSGQLLPTGNKEQDTGFRPAEFFTFRNGSAL